MGNNLFVLAWLGKRRAAIKILLAFIVAAVALADGESNFKRHRRTVETKKSC